MVRKAKAKTFSFTEEDLEVFAVLQEALGAESDSATLREIVADACRWRMAHGAKPIHPAVPRPAARGVIGDYLEYVDALRDAAGLPGRDGQPSRFFLAAFPAGGWWETQGRIGFWAVLPKGEKFTADGTERSGQLFHGDPGARYSREINIAPPSKFNESPST